MAEATFSLDLHVLGPPLTFALSQDQTLHRKFEPALRRLIAGHPGGSLRPTWNGFFTYRKPINRFQMTCYPVFRDRFPSGADALDGLDGEYRRGMLLIQGEVLVVNDVRRFFQRHRHRPSNRLILQTISVNLGG